MTSRRERKASRSQPGKGHRTSDNSKARVTSTVTLSSSSRDPLYGIPRLDRDTLRVKGVNIRSSTSWLDCYNTPNGGLAVPYIDNLGRFTGHTIYKWSCDPRSLVATTVSTIARRLMVYARRHNKSHVVRSRSKDILGAAAYYAFSKNSYFLDRVLFFCRDLQKRGALINRSRLFFSSKWDDNKRFVYSQVIFQTNWLLFRAFRPRDKSLYYGGKDVPWTKYPRRVPPKISVTNCIREIAYAISSI